MKLDISFIPEEIIPYKLRYLSNQTIEHPYIDIDKFSSSNSQFQKNIMHRDNYFKFLSELGAFTRSQIKNKNFELAKKCCEYLQMIGNDRYGIRKLHEYCDKKIEDV